MVSWWVKNENIPSSHHGTTFWMAVWYLTAWVKYIGPPAPITGPGAPSDDGGSPSKKRQFQTHASPRTPALATSSSQPLFSAMWVLYFWYWSTLTSLIIIRPPLQSFSQSSMTWVVPITVHTQFLSFLQSRHSHPWANGTRRKYKLQCFNVRAPVRFRFLTWNLSWHAYSASIIANPPPIASSSRTQHIRTRQNLTTRSPQSASETIASDDDTPIASISFEHTATHDAAERKVRRSQRDSKGKGKARDE